MPQAPQEIAACPLFPFPIDQPRNPPCNSSGHATKSGTNPGANSNSFRSYTSRPQTIAPKSIEAAIARIAAPNTAFCWSHCRVVSVFYGEITIEIPKAEIVKY